MILTRTNRDKLNTVSRSDSEEERLHPALGSLTLSLFAPETKLEMEQLMWLEGPRADSKASALGCTWQVSLVVS